jgi:hypothetical protein
MLGIMLKVLVAIVLVALLIRLCQYALGHTQPDISALSASVCGYVCDDEFLVCLVWTLQ